MDNDRKFELGNEKVGKLLLKYSAPAMVGMMVNALYNLVDTIFIGQGVGTMAIAGLAVAFPIQMLVMAVAQTIGIGAASMISRNLGAGDQRKAEEIAGTSLAAIGVVSVIMTVLGFLVMNTLLRIFGATDILLPYAKEYTSVILMGTLPFSLAIAANSIVRSEGNAMVAMTSMVIGTALNIILDPIFIFVFKMGLQGAAIATVISFTTSCLYLVVYFIRGKSILKFSWKDITLKFALLGEIVSIGAASFVRSVAGSVLTIALNNSLAYYGTELHIAILGVGNRMLTFLLMPIFGVVQGLQPIVGFNYGAHQFQRVKKGLKLAIIATTVLSTVGFIVILLFTKQLLGIFNNDPALISQGAPIFRILVIFLPVVGFQVIGASLFQSIGKAVPALMLSMSRQILFLLPAILLFPLFMGLKGVWWAFPVADIFSTVVTAIWVVREIKILNEDSMVGFNGQPQVQE